MFNRFKKRIVPNSKEEETIQIPSANDTLEVTKQAWSNISIETIMEEIKYQSLRGERDARFYGALLSAETRMLLRLKGYSIEVHHSGNPWFKISW